MHSNFIYKQKNELKTHDVIVFKIKKEGRKHVGMYLGDDYFVIHQCGNSISQKTLLDKRWQKIKGVYRHPQLV